jgi:hypothetical protein
MLIINKRDFVKIKLRAEQTENLIGPKSYDQAVFLKSIEQIVNTVLLLILSWVGAYISLSVHSQLALIVVYA